MSIVKEFKTFAVRGNVADMAVGIVVGAAFGKITASLVGDILMPPIGLLLSGVDFSALVITLKEATADAAAVTLNYGKFIQTVVDFFIIAVAIFLLVKGMNALRDKEEAKPAPAPAPGPTKEEVLLAEIRDILKEK
jgi:large conductance mechanosensitive channel